MDAGEHELAAFRIGLQHPQIRNHLGRPQARQTGAPAPVAARAMAGGRHEIDPLDEGARRVPGDDEDLAGERRDLRRTARAGQTDLRPLVGPDDRRVDVAETVDLGRAEKAHRDTPALEPVAEDLRRRDHRVGRLGELAVADGKRQDAGLRADRAGFVDQHHVRRVRRAGQIGCGARQPDTDEADRAVAEQAGRGDRHHLVGGEAPFSHGRPRRRSARSRRNRRCRARGAPSTR